MKRLLLICSLWAITLSPAFSQTIQLTNGGSTTTAGSISANPVSQYFEYMRFQVVYTAAELNAAGITGPKTITQLGWYISTAPANGLPSYTISMANTTATNSAAHNTAALTQVYSSASYAPVAGGFDMLTLNGAFVWNGTDNLLVDVCYGAAVYASPYGDVRTYAATTTSGSRRVRCDACGSQCGNTTGTTNTFKPQVSLTFAPPPSCNAPTVNVVPGSTSAAVSWGAVSGATGYEWAVTTSATPPASGTATALTSANATGLTGLTQYYAHVRTACGAAFSTWSTVPFTTSIDCSAAEVISGCGISKTASLSGTGVYNITSCGFSTPGTEKLYSFTPTITGNYTLNITASNGEWIDYFYKDASGGCGNTGWTCIDDNNAVGTDVFGPLTAGVTYYILLDPEDGSVTSTHTFDITCPAGAPPPCTTNLTPANGATGVSPVTLTWNAAPGATGYNVFFGTTNPPTTNIGSTATTTTTVTGTLPGTTYYWYVQPTNTAGGATGCETSTFSLTTAAAPVNDTVCGAITLTVGGPQDCQNTTTATSAGDPTLPGGCSSPNNTVWYKYTPATNGTVAVRMEIPGTSTSPLNGWVSWYTATGTCPSPPGLTLTALAGSACQEFGQTGAGDIDTLTSPALTGGTTYYIMIDGFSGDAGDFCISLVPPPAPPACTTNLLPANGATGVVISPAPVISWNPAANATSYDVYFGTINPPTTNIGNTTATSATITGLSYNTTYYWYVVPKNTGGSATGCQTSTTSFTTENPANCTPLYGSGCSLADSLTYFSLKGATGTVIYNQSGATCNATPVAYSDYTGAFSPVTLVRGESFGGFMRTGDPNDYASIWIDGNDNGYFEDNERLMNNLKIGTTMRLYTLYIPTTVPLGTHRMRVRVVYSGTTPTTPTHPCNPYTYGETEDYLVTITNVGSTHLVATGTPGSCEEGGQIVIDAASNNNGASPVFMVDSLNNYIAAIYPDGNNLGTVTPSTYVHNGPVRQDVTGRYYLDRTITINVTTQPISSYRARLFYRNSELNALIAQPGSGVTSQFDLVSTKSGIFCNPGYNGAGTVIFPTGFGSLSGDRFLDFTGLNSFSSFYFHGGASPLLPINLLSFAGQREGLVNRLRWTTASESNSRGFDVQRSADGINYESIGFVNSLAPGGNSSDQLSYGFADNNVGGRKWYYRLRLVDLDGRNSLSNVVLIKGEKPVTMSIEGIYPNPANTKVNVMVAAPVRDKLTLVVTDMTGKNVMQQIISAEAGSNTISLDISKLSGGTYLIKLLCDNCETAVAKFVKQ